MNEKLGFLYKKQLNDGRHKVHLQAEQKKFGKLLSKHGLIRVLKSEGKIGNIVKQA